MLFRKSENRKLQTLLSEEEYEQLEYEWKEQLELRNELKDKPSDLQRYEEKLKQATLTKRFPKTRPKPRGPRRTTRDLSSKSWQTRSTIADRNTGPWGFFMTDRGPRASDQGSGKVAG